MAIKITPKEFERLKAYMYEHFGINLANKQVLVEGRLGNFLERRGYTSLNTYIDYVIEDKSEVEVKRLIERLTTNYTYFFRERAHYDFMQSVALPDLTARIKNKDLRTWSAGCSSGEEPYTTAMIINEYFGGKKQGWDTTILATDISDQVLNVARQGVYEAEKLEKIPAMWRQKYFVKTNDISYTVTPELKKEIVFGTFNLMDKVVPFRKKFHIIFCRNVMIYFDAPTKEALLNRFYDVLEEGGYMFIGLSETMAGLKTKFEYIKPSIYRKGGRT